MIEIMASFQLASQSSIELEPRTLSFRELQLARESAIHMMKSKSLEEAMKIFTDDLQSGPRIAENSRRLDDFSYVDSEDEGDGDEVEDEMTDYCFRPWIH